MLRVWREDQGESAAVEYDLDDPEIAACRLADDADCDEAGDYWGQNPPIVVVEDAEGRRTRWAVEATTEHIAWQQEDVHHPSGTKATET